MDLAKTAREITRFMLPYLTTRQSRQLEKFYSTAHSMKAS